MTARATGRSRRAAGRGRTARSTSPAARSGSRQVAEHRRGAPPRLLPASALPPDVAAPPERAAPAGLRPHARPAAADGGPERDPRQLLRRRPALPPAGGAGPRPGHGRRPAPTSSTSAANPPAPAPILCPRPRRSTASSRSSPRCAPRASRSRSRSTPATPRVARAAFDAGADLLNDVSALTHDPASLGARGRVRPAGLPDACAGRPEDDAGRARLRRRPARRLRLPRGPRRGGRGGGHPARPHPGRSRHRLRQDASRTTSR